MPPISEVRQSDEPSGGFGLVAPFLLVAATVFATWLLSGVALDEAARFLAFELLYVLFPGCLLYVLLSPSPGGWLRVLAVGWPCGYAIEVGAFAATAALHARGIFTLLPLAGVALAAPFLLRARGRARLEALRRGTLDRSNDSRGDEHRTEAMAVAVVLSAGLLLLALMYFASYPLPAHAHSVFYLPDNIDHISLAAEARHHWPMTLPWVAGLPERYYVAVFVHFAAVNQVAGVPLSTVVLRLFPAMAMVVIALQLWSVSRSLGRSRWIAPTAVGLLLIVADLNLDFTRPGAFAAETFNTLPGSPSYALGLIFFLGLLALAQSWFTDTDTAHAPRRRPWAGPLPRGSAGLLVLVGVLAIGASASKTTAIVDFIAGLGLLWLWRLARGQSSRLLSCGLVVSAVSFLVVYLSLLTGGYASGLLVHPLDFMHYTLFGPTFTAATGNSWPVLAGHSFVWLVALLGAAAVTLLFTLTPLLAAGWLLLRPRAISTFALLCFAIFVVSLLAYLMLAVSGNSEGYFLIYGYIALVPIAAKGLVGVLEAIPLEQRRKVASVCAAVLVVGLAVGESSRAVSGSGRASWYAWYAVAYGVAACAVAVAVLDLQRGLTAAITSRAARIFACCVPLLLTLGLVKSLMQMESRAWGTVTHERISLADSGAHQGITAALYDGLIWVRDHTTPCDVLAVNNHYTYAAHRSGASAANRLSFYDYYSAFTERRVLLESWYSTPRGGRSAVPYPARLALNDLAVVDGSASALRALARDGVGYVLIDRTHGEGALEPAGVSRLVFENSALRVYRLLTPPRAVGGCGTVTGI
jgi:hypothetical protein